MEKNYQSKIERIVYDLRGLFTSHGYSHFNMSKFEEYDYYANNKDFLVSDNIITFNDTDGRLLALKPDVTLSIVKNAIKEKGSAKLFYNENVYRVSPTSHNFKEIMQTGLECIGDIDEYALCEVLLLACKSLDTVWGSSVLDISHMGIISALIKKSGANGYQSKKILSLLAEKNTHELIQLFGENGLDMDVCNTMVELLSWNIDLERAEKLLSSYCGDVKKALDELKTVFGFLNENGYRHNVRLDFSIVSDMNYYSGIVFKGYVEGIPDSVLSGGRYDSLLEKMGCKKGALGFAVYLDGLERLYKKERGVDFDLFIKYGQDKSPVEIYKMVQRMTALGKSVMAGTVVPENRTFGEIIEI